MVIFMFKKMTLMLATAVMMISVIVMSGCSKEPTTTFIVTQEPTTDPEKEKDMEIESLYDKISDLSLHINEEVTYCQVIRNILVGFEPVEPLPEPKYKEKSKSSYLEGLKSDKETLAEYYPMLCELQARMFKKLATHINKEYILSILKNVPSSELIDLGLPTRESALISSWLGYTWFPQGEGSADFCEAYDSWWMSNNSQHADLNNITTKQMASFISSSFADDLKQQMEKNRKTQ